MKVSLMYLPSVGTRQELEAGVQLGRDTAAYQRMLKHVTEQAQLAEDLGYHSIAFTEHHFQTEGLEVNPDPLMLCLYVGLRTSRIRLGTNGVQLPTWNPVRLAEQVAVIDQMLQGRFDLGIVRGAGNREIQQHGQPYGVELGPPGSPGDQKNRAVLEEHYEILKQLLHQSGDTLKIKTEHWELPRTGSAMPDLPFARWVAGVGEPISLQQDSIVAGSGLASHVVGAAPGAPAFDMRPVHEIGLAPKPYQDPFPPFYIPFISSPPTIQWAAREGMRVVFYEGVIARFQELADIYTTAALEANYDVAPGDGVCACVWIHVGETDAEVRRVAEPSVYWLNQIYYAALSGTQFPGEDRPSPITWPRFVGQHGIGMAVGTPDEVYGKLSRLIEETNVEQIFLQTGADLLPHDEMMKSIELFGKEVLPRLTAKKEQVQEKRAAVAAAG